MIIPRTHGVNNVVARGSQLRLPLRSQNQEFGAPRGENYSTTSHFHRTMTHLLLSLAEVSPQVRDIAANQGRPSLSRDPPDMSSTYNRVGGVRWRLHRPAHHNQKHPRIVVVVVT